MNANYQSEVPHIYAAGDVIGSPALAGTAIEQARVAVCHAFDSTFKCDLARVLPTGIYTIPEASMVGDTEAALREKRVDFVAGRARYADLPRGEIIGDRSGFLKLIFRREDMRLLGVPVIGEQATELVHIGLVAMLGKPARNRSTARASTTRPLVTCTGTQPTTRLRSETPFGEAG